MRKLILLCIVFFSFKSYSQFIENIDDYVFNNHQLDLIKSLKVSKKTKSTFSSVNKKPSTINTSYFDINGNLVKHSIDYYNSSWYEEYYYDSEDCLVEDAGFKKNISNNHLKEPSGSFSFKTSRPYKKRIRPYTKKRCFDSLSRVKYVWSKYPKLKETTYYNYYNDSTIINTYRRKSKLVETKIILNKEFEKISIEKNRYSKDESRYECTYYPEKLLLIKREFRNGESKSQNEIYFNDKMQIIKTRLVNFYLDYKTKKRLSNVSITTYTYEDKFIKETRTTSKSNKSIVQYFYRDDGLLLKVLKWSGDFNIEKPSSTEIYSHEFSD